MHACMHAYVHVDAYVLVHIAYVYIHVETNIHGPTPTPQSYEAHHVSNLQYKQYSGGSAFG